METHGTSPSSQYVFIILDELYEAETTAVELTKRKYIRNALSLKKMIVVLALPVWLNVNLYL